MDGETYCSRDAREGDDSRVTRKAYVCPPHVWHCGRSWKTVKYAFTQTSTATTRSWNDCSRRGIVSYDYEVRGK
jgi:hypothetical protein